MDASLFPLERCLPHAEPMILLDQLLEITEDSARCQVQIDQHHPFWLEGEGVPGWVGIELMAQTIAAFAGYHSLRQNEPVRLGFLLGSRRYTSQLAHFHAGQKLVIEVERSYEEGGMSAFDCQIHAAQKAPEGSVPLAQAQLCTFRPEPDEINRYIKDEPRHES